jgi:murein DD-endopeptidase MepM/ murein hydrolase activator NlpD
VLAVEGGIVTLAGPYGGYGLAVVLAGESGWVSLYGHCSRLVVERGERVQAGQALCLSGNTGHSSGPHVHYELRRQGRPVDPAPYLEGQP